MHKLTPNRKTTATAKTRAYHHYIIKYLLSYNSTKNRPLAAGQTKLEKPKSSEIITFINKVIYSLSRQMCNCLVVLVVIQKELLFGWEDFSRAFLRIGARARSLVI